MLARPLPRLARLTWRAALPAAAAALTLVAGLSPARAAGPPAWTISAVLGAPSYPLLQALSVSGPDNAWVSGTTYQSLLAEHWDGTQWTPVTPPPSVDNLASKTVNDSIMGSSSPANTWFFPQVSGATTTKTLGLVWNGSAWRTVKVPATDSLLGVNVLGPHNVWQWGTKPAPPGTLGSGPPWLRHYNGTTWKTVLIPGVASGASVVSASDMWAVGPTAATAGDAGSQQVFIAMHWNGKKWAAASLPVLAPLDGAAWSPASIVALGPDNVWIAEVPQGSLGGTPGPQATTLLHWDGSTWATAAQDPGVDLGAGMTGDGTGGLWLTGSDTQASYLVQFAGGTFTPQAVPARPATTAWRVPWPRFPAAPRCGGSARCSPPAAASTKPTSCVTAADQAGRHAGSGRRGRPWRSACRDPGPAGVAGPGDVHAAIRAARSRPRT